MAIEKTSLIDIVPTDIDVDIRILSVDSGRYQGFIQTKWYGPIRFNVEPSQMDIEEINAELQREIEKISGDTDINDGFNGSLANLADSGKYFFSKIFTERSLRKIISSSFEKGTTITLSSDNFFIPWEMLYHGPLTEEIDIDHLWGMRYIITRNLIQDYNGNGNYIGLERPTLPLHPEVGLIVYEDENLKYVEKEIKALENFAQQNQLTLYRLDALDAKNRFKELERLKYFMYEKDLQVIHFACHAQQGISDSEAHLLISNEFDVTIKDVTIHEFQLKNYPLVVLNACQTGISNPLSAISNWAIEFSKIGARGILATEFHVPDWFAAIFVEELYKHLLSGKQIGKALMNTRRHFWNYFSSSHNLLGIAYALYGPSSLRIAEPEQKIQQSISAINVGE